MLWNSFSGNLQRLILREAIVVGGNQRECRCDGRLPHGDWAKLLPGSSFFPEKQVCFAAGHFKQYATGASKTGFSLVFFPIFLYTLGKRS